MGKTPVGHHPNHHCDRSGMNPIVGWRYNLRGHDFDLCEAEFIKLPAKEQSLYNKIAPPATASASAVDATAQALQMLPALVAQSGHNGPISVTMTQQVAPAAAPAIAVVAEVSSRRISEDSIPASVVAASLAEVAARRNYSAEERAAMATALSLSPAEEKSAAESSRSEEELALALSQSLAEVVARREQSAEEKAAMALALSESQADVRAGGSVYEVQPVRAQEKLFVTVPEGAAAGTVLHVSCPAGAVEVTVPEGVAPGTQHSIAWHTPAKQGMAHMRPYLCDAGTQLQFSAPPTEIGAAVRAQRHEDTRATI